MIPYGRQSIDKEDVEAVLEVLSSDFLTQGPTIPAFEKALCEYTGAQFCTAVNSGTSALHIACLAADVDVGDIVWTVPNSFVASANCALYCGASIDFVDIDPITRNIDAGQLGEKLTIAEKENKLPKVLVVVHFAGISCDMEQIKQLTKAYNICIVEDASHALGGTYKGKPVGSCQFSDMTVFSFHPVKSITTAEGGAVMTNCSDLANRLSLFSKHGITRDNDKMSGDKSPWCYEQHYLGYNYRLSDIHAVLGISQLNKLDKLVSKRKAIVQRYQTLLAAADLKLPFEPDYADSAWHLYVVELISKDRQQVFNEMRARGVGVNVHYIPIHTQPYYQKLGFREGDFPVSEKYYQMALSLPVFPDMIEEQQNYVVQNLLEVIA